MFKIFNLMRESMKVTSYSQLRNNLRGLLDEVDKEDEDLVVTSKGTHCVIVSRIRYDNLVKASGKEGGYDKQ